MRDATKGESGLTFDLLIGVVDNSGHCDSVTGATSDHLSPLWGDYGFLFVLITLISDKKLFES